MADRVLKALIGKGQARVFLADTTVLCEKARELHGTSPVCTAALGRILTGAVLMGLQLKGDEERISLDFQGNGPAGRAMAVCDRHGRVKGYVTDPAVDLPPRGTKLDVGGAIGKDGFLTVIRGEGTGEPYVGRCALVSGEIAEDLATYYLLSEQTPSLMSLGVMVEKDRSVAAAGGILIQPLPGCSEEILSQLELRAPVMGDTSALIRDYPSLESLLIDLFRGLDPEVIGEEKPEWHCECSRERIASVLVSLGRDELEDLIRRDGGAQVHCHFCNTTYDFNAEELKTLADAAGGEKGREDSLA